MNKNKNLILDGPLVMPPEEIIRSWIKSVEEAATSDKEDTNED